MTWTGEYRQQFSSVMSTSWSHDALLLIKSLFVIMYLASIGAVPARFLHSAKRKGAQMTFVVTPWTFS
jgi:hypothetical protein